MKLPALSQNENKLVNIDDEAKDHNQSQIDTRKSLPDGSRIVQAVMKEIKEGFNVKMQNLPKMSLTFEDLSVWAKVKISKGFCKSGRLDFNF